MLWGNVWNGSKTRNSGQYPLTLGSRKLTLYSQMMYQPNKNSVGRRGNSIKGLKTFGEIGEIVEPHPIRNLCYRICFLGQ